MSSARTMDTKLQEPEGFGEENSGKKKSKFKSIKKFFGKRKRKETLSASGSGSLKPCQSASDVTASQTTHIDYDSEDELEMHRSTMGSRALSHDSIFIPEVSPESAGPARVFSQENVSDRIKALQMKLQQNWKAGLPYPFGISSKRVDDAGMNSEDDGLPRSPPETSLLHEILNSSTAKFSDSHKHLSSLSLAGTGSEEEEQVTASPSRFCSTESQLIPQQPNAKIIPLRTPDCSLPPPADFDTPPEFSSCLDNSAAKHKLLVKPRNQRSSRTRRPPSRNLSTSQNDLSSTLEQDECDGKEMVAELSNEREELAGPPSQISYVQLPEVSKGLHHKLTSQDVCMLPSTAELDLLLCEKTPEDSQIMQELPQMIPLPSPSDSEEDTVTPYLTPDQKKEEPEPLKMPSGDIRALSHSILNQENKQKYDTPSKNGMLSDRNVSAQKDVILSPDGIEKTALKDPKVLLEDTCNKGTIKRSPLTNSVNFSPKNTFHSTLPSHEHSSISQSSCTASTSEMGRPSFLTPDAVKQIQEQPESGKQAHCMPIPVGLVLREKEEKEGSELYGLRKFSVSSARGRPRTSSLNMNETLECENSLAVQALQVKTKSSTSNENMDVEVSCSQEKKRCTKKQTSQSESELEVADEATDRVVVASHPQSVGSKPVLSKSSTGLPWQSSVGQSNGEDKNPFQVKLRSTSLSLKHRDGFAQGSKETKRYSAEFSLEKEVLPMPSLKGEKAEVRKTTDVNISRFSNDSLKMKSKSSEQSATKPPLPRKPVMQHFIISGTNTITEEQERVNKYPEFKNEDRDSEKKQSLPELEKSVPSHGIFVDAARMTESQTVPAWIIIAKQKQRAMEQELSKEEKPVVQEEKTEAEKQIQEKERVEESVREQTDFTQSTFLPFPPTVSSEKQKKETKLDIQVSLPRASMLSHHIPVQSSLVPSEKEDIKPLKKMSHSPEQPSWMELAKKKSQAWSDMPQRIK